MAGSEVTHGTTFGSAPYRPVPPKKSVGAGSGFGANQNPDHAKNHPIKISVAGAPIKGMAE
jgi:hypothetical protein